MMITGETNDTWYINDEVDDKNDKCDDIRDTQCSGSLLASPVFESVSVGHRPNRSPCMKVKCGQHSISLPSNNTLTGDSVVHWK